MLTMMPSDRDMWTFDKTERGIILYHFRDATDVKYAPAAMIKFPSKRQANQLLEQLKIMVEEMK